MLRELTAFFIAAHTVELHQRKLYLGVPGVARSPLRDEALVNMPGVFQAHIEKLALARCLAVSRRRLVKMSRAVHLVTFEQVRPALVPVFYREVGVEVAVLVLRRGYQRDELVCAGFKLLVWVIRKRVSRRFEPFCGVGVLKHHTVKAVARVLAAQSRSRVAEILVNVAFLGACPVAENVVLIGDNGIPHELLILPDEPARLVACNVCLCLYLHICTSVRY